MVRQVLYAALLLSLCVLIHATGTVAMARAIKVRVAPTTGVRLFRPLLDLAVGFVLVFFLQVLEVLVWAGAYVALGAIGSLEEAIYFSIVSFTTVGYGDVVLPRDWRILGASEAAAGILIFGWSIALLIVLIERTMKQLI
jgi:voltage-gated potassium channel Kch